jgi:predicted GNAT superfamily acetyltransferase
MNATGSQGARARRPRSPGIRRVSRIGDLRSISDVVTAVTGYADIHPAVLLTVVNTGGYAAGVWDDGLCVAALYGLIGIRDGQPYLHSEMLAVLPGYRAKHVARDLKLDQRRFAIERGMDLITWTFDPLRGPNASLNIRGLGCVVTGYAPDMYGDLPGFSGGWPTDQLHLEWRVRSARVQALLAGQISDRDLPGPGGLPTVIQAHRRRDGLLAPGDVDLGLERDDVLVEIPGSVQDMRTRDMPLVLDWRRRVREALTGYLARGYRVRWFYTCPGQPARRNFYLVSRAGTEEQE